MENYVRFYIFLKNKKQARKSLLLTLASCLNGNRQRHQRATGKEHNDACKALD
jgi:hypothetical protein